MSFSPGATLIQALVTHDLGTVQSTDDSREQGTMKRKAVGAGR